MPGREGTLEFLSYRGLNLIITYAALGVLHYDYSSFSWAPKPYSNC